MKNSVKSLLVLWILVALSTLSCDKGNDSAAPAVNTTYKLTLIAAIPADGVTIYNLIRYKRADGTITTIRNRTTSFQESFDIPVGHNILFEVTGVNDDIAMSAPPFNLGYTVEKYENGVRKALLCMQYSYLASGSGGAWNISTTNNFTFNGTTCQ